MTCTNSTISNTMIIIVLYVWRAIRCGTAHYSQDHVLLICHFHSQAGVVVVLPISEPTSRVFSVINNVPS